MAELSVRPTLTIVKAPKTESDVDKYLLKTGRCPTCKMQTHERKGSMFNRTLVPLTNEQVLNGRCLLCHPIGGDGRKEETQSGPTTEGAATGPSVASLSSQKFSWNGEAIEESYWHDAYLEDQYKQQQQSEPTSDAMVENGAAEPEIAVPSSEGEVPGPAWLPDSHPDQNMSIGHHPSSSTSDAPAWLNIDVPPISHTKPCVPSQANPPSSPEPTIYVPQTTTKAKAREASLGEVFVPDISSDLKKQGPSTASERRYSDGVYEGSVSPSGQRSGYGVMTFDNGDVHEGEWKLDVRSGRGKFTDAEGNMCEGTWENDRMNGYGVFRLVNGCEYAGQIKDGSWSGQGTYKSAEGDRYAGPFRDGEFHGPKGTMRYADGNQYTGDWVCGIRDGKGIFKWSDGEVDLSAYAGHDRDGRGVRFSADGKTAWELVDGDLTHEITPKEAREIANRLGLAVPKNVPSTSSSSRSSNSYVRSDQQHTSSDDRIDESFSSTSSVSRSKGYTHPYLRRKFESTDEPDLLESGNDAIPSNIKEKTFAIGNYRGHINQSGQREGQGTMNYNDGSQYIGSWRADMRQGKGSCRWPDGSAYVGEWIDDEMSGHGTHTYRNGDSYEGEFCASARHGRGTYRNANGLASVLCYRDNIPTGRGARWTADGTKAFSLKDGRIREQIALGEAERIARHLGLAVPEATKSTQSDESGESPRSRSCGFAAVSAPTSLDSFDVESEKEHNSVTGDDSKQNKSARLAKKFRMGMYEGELNAEGEREGHGTMRYNSGARFDGQWIANKKKLGYNRSSGGDLYVGEFRSHQKFGEGVEWSANRTKVWRVINGLKQEEISTEKAHTIVEQLGLEMPKK